MVGQAADQVAAGWEGRVPVDPQLQRVIAAGPPDADFGDRIRQAFILLEQRIRETANLGPDQFTTELVNNAFHPQTGILQPVSPVPAERTGLHQLLLGAFLYYRNPIAHRAIAHEAASAWHVFHLSTSP